jgi:hypothetical protein
LLPSSSALSSALATFQIRETSPSATPRRQFIGMRCETWYEFIYDEFYQVYGHRSRARHLDVLITKEVLRPVVESTASKEEKQQAGTAAPRSTFALPHHIFVHHEQRSRFTAAAIVRLTSHVSCPGPHIDRYCKYCSKHSTLTTLTPQLCSTVTLLVIFSVICR